MNINEKQQKRFFVLKPKTKLLKIFLSIKMILVVIKENFFYLNY